MLPRAGGLLSSHPHGAANGASDTPRKRRIPCWVGPGTAAVSEAGRDRPRGELETPGRAGLAQRSQRVGIDAGPSGLVAPGWHSQATLGTHPLGGRVHTHAPGRPSTAAQRRIATADVAVHACEPHLFDVLVGPWVAGPRGRPERAALLVNGQGLERRVHPAPQLCVMELPPAIDQVDRMRPADRDAEGPTLSQTRMNWMRVWWEYASRNQWACRCADASRGGGIAGTLGEPGRRGGSLRCG
jgi:hypothetical protein